MNVICPFCNYKLSINKDEHCKCGLSKTRKRTNTFITNVDYYNKTYLFVLDIKHNNVYIAYTSDRLNYVHFKMTKFKYDSTSIDSIKSQINYVIRINNLA